MLAQFRNTPENLINLIDITINKCENDALLCTL